MKAIILAAGEGKRLRPLTNRLPKCMVDLFGKSIIEHQIDVYRDCGIKDITIVTGYKSDKINFKNVKYYKNNNYHTTNMVETLFCAKNALNNPTIISYGDIIFEKSVLKKLIKSRYDCSIIIDKNWKDYWKIRFENPLSDAESLEVNSDEYIIDIGQKVTDIEMISGQFIGLMKFQRNGIKKLKNFYKEAKAKSKHQNLLNPHLKFEQSYMTDLLRGMINNDIKLKAVIVKSGWLELDSLKDYKIYQQMYKDKTISHFIKLPYE